MKDEEPIFDSPEFNTEDVEILRETNRFSGFFSISEFELRHRLYNGGWTPAFTRELFVRGKAVVVLLYDPHRDTLVLNEQFRIGALADHRSPWLLELVAGLTEPGETAEEVAHREAREEAGCSIKALEPIYEYWVSPGGTNESVAIYCGWVDTEGVGGVHGVAAEHEDIRVQVVKSQSAIDALATGAINNAASIIALQWLQNNKIRLQKLWKTNCD